MSVKRDGSVWVRVGSDRHGDDWVHENEDRRMYHGSVLSDQDIELLTTLHYTDLCVLTDLRVSFHSLAAWQPSYLIVYEASSKQPLIVNMEHNHDCDTRNVIRLSDNGDSLECFYKSKNVSEQKFNLQGGEAPRMTCGFPNNNHLFDDSSSDLDSTINNYTSNDNTTTTTPTNQPPFFNIGDISKNKMVLKTFSFEARDKDAWMCGGASNASNAFTFRGSYYYAYAKVAQCSPPTS